MSSDGNKKNVCLVVEDNYYAGDIMATYLRQKGVEVEISDTGKAAVELFAASPERYAVIFMDLQMPDISGYEATELIRRSGCEEARSVPIIAMSGDPINDLKKHGFSDILRKPFKMQEILPLIGGLLTA